MNVIPQLFEIWRKSVLLTVGAISLGAERLESTVMGLVKSGPRPERAPRVKVPVRAGKVEHGTARSRAAATTRKARVTRKPAAKSAKPAKPAAKARKVRVHAGHVPEATMATPSTTPVESLVSEASAN